MEEPVVVGIDIVTTKVCTLVARLEGDSDMRILGVGIISAPPLNPSPAPLKKPSAPRGLKSNPHWSAWQVRTFQP